MNRAELDRIIMRAEQDLHDLDKTIKRRQDQRSACEAELDRLKDMRESWREDDA